MQRVGAGQQRAQRRPHRPRQGHQPLGDGRRHEADRDRVRHEPVAQRLGIRARRVGRQVQARARDEVRPDLPHRGVEGRAGVERRAIVGGHAEGAAVPRDQIGEAAMGDLDALRSTSRARCVDHVREVLRLDDVVTRRRLPRPDRHLVDVEPWPGTVRQAGREAGFRDGDAWRRVLEHEFQSIRRRGRIDWQIRRTGLEHAECGDHERRRALEADRHDHVRAHLEGAQGIGQPAGAAGKLAVCQGLRCIRDGDRVGRLGGLDGYRLGYQIENHGSPLHGAGIHSRGRAVHLYKPGARSKPQPGLCHAVQPGVKTGKSVGVGGKPLRRRL